MNTCQYQEVNTHDEEVIMKEKESIRSILKQVLICSTVWTQYFSAGLAVGAPTVFIPQMRKDGRVIDEELASWFYTTACLGVYPWIFITPIMTKHIGRKIPEIFISVVVVISFIVLYYSESFLLIFISEILQGCLHGGNTTVTILIVTEYCSPKYRGLFLTIKSASFFWGIWLANFIGTFYHWKVIAILGFVSTIYTFNVFLWPESPFWLASKGKFDECKTAFRWIHGTNKESERDLRELISSQDESIRLAKDDNAVGYLEIIKSTEFYKPLILSLAAVCQYHFSGKLICTLYVLDIFKNITESESSAYTAMLVLDGVTVFGMYVGSFLSKGLRRRTLYMTTSFTGVAFLLLISLYLYLVRLTIIGENKYLTIALLGIYSVSISCGPMILSMSIYGEIVPIKYQASSYIIISLTFGTLYTLLCKLAPLMFSNFGVDGSFLLYGVTCGLCTLYLYIYLPETKNKTQREIEMFFKDKGVRNRKPDMIET